VAGGPAVTVEPKPPEPDGDPAPARVPGFDEVYRRFAPVVHGIALARVGPHDADDVTQEVFVAIHAGLARVRDAAALPGWVCAVARNTATDWLRRRARRTVPVCPAVEQVADPQPADLAGRELPERILALVRTLPDAYRETLVLRLVEGLTGPEIAERTGMTHGSLRVNLCRGMALLRPLLREEGWP